MKKNYSKNIIYKNKKIENYYLIYGILINNRKILKKNYSKNIIYKKKKIENYYLIYGRLINNRKILNKLKI